MRARFTPVQPRGVCFRLICWQNNVGTPMEETRAIYTKVGPIDRTRQAGVRATESYQDR